MLFLIILLPLVGALSGNLFGHLLGNGTCILTTLYLFISFCLSISLFQDVVLNSSVLKLSISTWFFVDYLHITWCFCFDSLTCIMLLVVTFISFLVHLYSIEYMEKDPHLPRFMSYLSLFTFFMLLLITANNFLQMFVGWEGVGLSSYLLINFWFTRIQANKAAIKAMLVNRIGDFFLLLALLTMILVFNSLDYDVIFSLVPLVLTSKLFFCLFEISAIDLICLLLFFGAMGKSAQLFLHTWLPDAMEGPTPVSALIHAATMVTAGVFLLIRCSYFLEFSPFVLNLILVVGASTAFFASTTGLFQNDLKKVIAYSTCSQLGYMVFACGLSNYEVSLFHLVNHAFFKALLFLGAGSIIHAIADEQDMRKMGGLRKLLPFSYAIMLIGSLALIGFPFLAGFYSKDTILEIAYAKYTLIGHFSYYLGSFAAFFTAFYSTRLLFLVFLVEPNGNKEVTLNAHEGSWKLVLPLCFLAFLSVLIGFILKDLFIGFGTSFWGAAIFILPSHYLLVDIEFISLTAKLAPLIVTLMGALLAFFLYIFKLDRFFKLKQTRFYKLIYNFLNKKWYFDKLYNTFLNQSVLDLGYFVTYQKIDRGLLELLGPTGIIGTLIGLGNSLKKLQSGNLFTYLILFFFVNAFLYYLGLIFSFSLSFLIVSLFFIFLCFF